MKHSLLTAACLCFGLGLGAAESIAGQDGKFYPGSFCKIAEEDHEHRNKLRYGSRGFVVNQSQTDRVRVVCPIIRDEMNTNRGVGVRVFIHDSNPSESLACQLFETGVWGDVDIERPRAKTTDFIVNGVNLGSLCNTGITTEFHDDRVIDCSLALHTEDSIKFNGSRAGGGLHMVCGLPPRTTTGQFSGRSGIGGYFVEERMQ
jgi:hypothetical protein